jgi:hypothetical protein
MRGKVVFGVPKLCFGAQTLLAHSKFVSISLFETQIRSPRLGVGARLAYREYNSSPKKGEGVYIPFPLSEKDDTNQRNKEGAVSCFWQLHSPYANSNESCNFVEINS